MLYHPERARLDISMLTEEYRSLGESVQQLGKWSMEASRLAGELTDGKLGEDVHAELPLSDNQNVFAGNIQTIRRCLHRMTNQIEEIIRQSGGYNADLLPEQRNFDSMVQELRRRTSALENERNLFVRFTESASERIVVLDEENGDILFANRVAREFYEGNLDTIDDANEINKKSGCDFENSYCEWIHTVVRKESNGKTLTEYYHVHSLYILWETRSAIAHMFSNVTALQNMRTLVQRDSLTGAFTRAYAMDHIERLISEDKAFSLAFVDVDYLKYCNDAFGHPTGDRYLIQVVSLLQQTEEHAVISRTGGDEFMVISEIFDSVRLAERMDLLRQRLCLEFFPDSAIHKSFSYGISAYLPGSGATGQTLLSEADERMYQNKLENKKNNHLSIWDSRIR